ncbi:hypothetical protein PpBr36_01684 [Pyricularia pennisetigena]|uniref:hypothetical protein n=1 Tax=Pyricularia pennisetigena TaxID=1578925 RepID=UPI00115237CD|nr:hypothetical protein PpBr36_01684 [Pyricularia pennisetigena]TLS28169.1 hypothetical protein PpBr36_01684 [Pyricularia pennisetigena]
MDEPWNRPDIKRKREQRLNKIMGKLSRSQPPKRQKQIIPGATTDEKGMTMERLRQKYPGRNALGMYIEEPEAFPPFWNVIYYNDDFVAIRDLYPKSSVHLLLLPRSEAFSKMHPLKALSSDAGFLAKVREEAVTLKRIVASELRRMYGEESASEVERTKALLDPDSVDELPKGRDWEEGIKVGVHATPSMNHLHIHFMSPDNVGRSMKTAHHYLSFNTGFLVRLEEFPLAETDPRWKGGQEFFSSQLTCWRCQEPFQSAKAFSKLKSHLVQEFEEWKKE